MPRSTNTDPSFEDRAPRDVLVRLREWGSDHVHDLPSSSEWILGAAPSCSLRLEDPSSRLSRRHARLVRTRDRWTIQDLGSKNGLWIDGARCREHLLGPGDQIRLGGVTLIAESPRSIALRGFLSRLLGWTTDRIEVVDQALRSLHAAAAGWAPLVLRGTEDLVPIAHELHRRSLGPERPFLVCDPRRRRSERTVRTAANIERAVPAVRAAAGGSICVRDERLPPDFAEAHALAQHPGARVQLIVCAREPARTAISLAAAISVPPLSRRARELARIVAEYAHDAIARLDAPRTSFRAQDRDWIRAHAASSFTEIEKATLRLIAVRSSGSVNHAAARLGMSHAALSRWLARRAPGAPKKRTAGASLHRPSG